MAAGVVGRAGLDVGLVGRVGLSVDRDVGGPGLDVVAAGEVDGGGEAGDGAGVGNHGAVAVDP